MFKYIFAGVCLATLNASAAMAEHQHGTQEPIGVMGTHDHEEGEIMLSYRYSRMEMDGNRSGTSGVSTAQVLSNFMVAPLDMDMEMHMVSAMVGVGHDLTLMGMVPYVEKSMRHINRMGVRFTTESDGLGDIKLGGVYKLYENHEHEAGHSSEKVLLNFGASLPTGSTDERDLTPLGNQKLPYPMQLGSGTVDPMLGITYVKQLNEWAFGAQANSVLRFGDNSEGYRLGNEYGLTGWAARDLNKHISLSLRLDGRSWGDINGRDAALNPAMVPTARTDLRGGERVDALIGLSLYQPDGALQGNRLAAEFGLPVYQNLDGPQLETDYRLIIGWQGVF